MKKLLFLSCLALSACSPTKTLVKHLGPLPEPAKSPAVCKIVSLLPDSPAKKAGLKTGDTLKKINSTVPADAAAASDLIQASGANADFEILDSAGRTRQVKVALNKEKPRLGASCDLTGWRKNSVSAAGNEAVTVFSGPYAFTVSGIIDKGIAFMRVRITNQSERALPVSAAVFSVTDPQGAAIKILTPQEVIYFMHGDDAVPLIKPPEGVSMDSTVPMDSLARQRSQPHKDKEDWTRSDETYVQSNATYLNKETFWPTTVEPGKFSDGLIYFFEPKTLPLKIEAKVDGRTMGVRFSIPQPSTLKMTIDELIHFFEAQTKGTAIRLTRKDGKVFVGKFSSYDAINEIVWFDTPSGLLLTTSSFGVKHIAYAEKMSPDQDKPQSSEPAEAPASQSVQ